MLIYQLIDILISVLDYCNTLTTNNHHSEEIYMSNHSSSQVNTYLSNTYLTTKIHKM